MSSTEESIRDKLRALPRTDPKDPRYPIDAYEDDHVEGCNVCENWKSADAFINERLNSNKEGESDAE